MTFPDFENWNAPWEGEGKEFDAELAKKFAYNLKRSENEAKEKLGSVDTELEEYKAAIEKYKKVEEDAKRENESEIESANRARDEAQQKLKEFEGSTARENLILKVRLEKGLTESQAKRISGDTFEELSADADEYLKDVVPAEAVDEDEDGDLEADQLNRTPKLRNSLTKQEDLSEEERFQNHIKERANRNPFLA